MLTLEPSPPIWYDPSVCILGLKIQLGGVGNGVYVCSVMSDLLRPHGL